MADDALNLEGQGILEKYGAGHLIGSKWQKRFVRCQRDIIELHHYSGAPPARGAVPSRIVDLAEVGRVLARPDTLTIELFGRKDEARVVLLKAATLGELEFWAGIFKQKVAYLEARRGHEEEEPLQLRFVTNTFTMLALMEDRDIEELAETTVEEAFLDEGAAAAAAAAALADLDSPGPADDDEEEDGAAALSWAVGGSPIRSSRASDAADNDDDGSNVNGGGVSVERAVAGVAKVLAVLEGLVEDLATELRAAVAAGEEKKVALMDRLFALYYGSIEDRLVMEVATSLGQQGSGSLEHHPSASSLMAALAGWRRLRRFDERVQAALSQLPGDAAAGLRSARRLADGSGLTAVLEQEATLIGRIVSLALHEAQAAWEREVQALQRYYNYSSSSSSSSSSAMTTLEEEPSPRRFTVSVRRRPLSMTAPSSSADDAQRRPASMAMAPSPQFSSAIDALERLLAGMEPWYLEDEAEADRAAARQQAAFLRRKGFTTAVLFLSGEVATLPLQVRNEADEALVLAVVEDLRRCQERVVAVEEAFFGAGGGGNDDAGEEAAGAASPGDMDEVAAVFAQAAERFCSERAGALLLDHALQEDAQLQKLLGMLFVHPSWRRGEVTPLLVGRFGHVLEGPLLGRRLPPVLRERVEARLLRSFLVLYLRQLLRLTAHTRAFEAEDAMGFLMDETAVQEWVEFRGKWASRPQRLEDLWVLKRIRIWLLMPPGEALDQYAEAWLQTHPTLGPHLYDLLRFCLLLRRDVDAAAARSALLAVHEFVAQLGAATGRLAASPAPVPSSAKILGELFPRAGVQHITGEAWRWEVPAGKEEQEALAVAVGPLVLKVCEKLRAPRPAKPAGGASPERMPVLQLPVLVDGKAVAAAPKEEQEVPAAVPPAAAEAAAPVAAVASPEVEEEEEERAPQPSPKVAEPPQLPASIVTVVTVSPRAMAAAASAQQPPPLPPTTPSSPGKTAGAAPPALPLSPSASSVASSANPFEDEDEEGQAGGPAAASSAAASPPPQGTTTTGRRVFGGGMAFGSDDAQVGAAAPAVAARPPPPPPPPPVPPAPPSPSSQEQQPQRRVFGGGLFSRSGSRSPREQQPQQPQQQQEQPRVVAPAPPSPAATAAVVNPFEDEDEDEGGPARPPPPPQPQPQRRVFGGGMVVAAAPAPPPRPPPAVVQPRVEQVPVAAAGPRRFGGGWGGDDERPAAVPAPVVVGAAPPRRSPVPVASPTAGPRPLPPPQQQQQQPAQQEGGDGGGRRSFGGQGGGWW